MTIYFGHEDGWRASPRGCIRIEPFAWLREKGSTGNFRKLLKLCVESDCDHGTATLAEWEKAIRERAQHSTEHTEQAAAEHEHKARVRAAAAWRDAHLAKEEARFQRAKVHRGPSHAERVQAIETRYEQMCAADERRGAREADAIRKRAARERALAAAQMDAVRSFAEKVARDGLRVEWIAHMQAYRIYHAAFPAQTVAYEDTLAAFYERTVV